MAHRATGLLGELGLTGLDRQAGDVFEEFLTQLKLDKANKIFREMRDNDPVIGAMLFAVEMLIRQVEWRVSPAGDSDADDKAKEFLEQNMDDMEFSWTDTISEILSMVPFGYSWHEIVYKRRHGQSKNPQRNSGFDDGLIGWRKLPIRSQDSLDSWKFGPHGEILGMFQRPPPNFQLIFLPREKSLLFRPSIHKNNPQGRSMLRNAFRPWFFKKRIETFEAIGAERDLAGYPVGFIPSDILDPKASAEKQAIRLQYEKVITNIRRDEQEGLLWPSDRDENGNRLFELELLSSGGRRQFDTNAIITRYDQRIAITMLADFILLGQTNVGSFALSSNKTKLFAVAIGSILDSITEEFNTNAIPKLFDLNPGFKIEKRPRLEHGDIESADLKDLGDYIAKLSSAGMPLFPDDELENALRVAGDLPEKSA